VIAAVAGVPIKVTTLKKMKRYYSDLPWLPKKFSYPLDTLQEPY